MTEKHTPFLTILGCSDSCGVPRIGGDWGKCDPHEKRNNRMRPCVAVQSKTTTIVVDTGPDFRHQLTRENILSVDAILYTHSHSDHVNGIDECRPLHDRFKRRVPLYMMQETLTELQARFSYLFKQSSQYYPPVVEPHILPPEAIGARQFIGDLEYVPFLQDHGTMHSLGFRFGDIAYSTDMSDLGSAAIETLKGIKVWVADGANLYWKDSILHPTLERVLELQEKIGVPQIYLTHMKYDLDYKTLCDTLPAGIRPCFDGLKIALDGTVLNDDAR
jgi:phosphoribosyl 1,2-cyclic phosphate phosphodiesterase